jgi:hypothetical protein
MHPLGARGSSDSMDKILRYRVALRYAARGGRSFADAWGMRIDETR